DRVGHARSRRRHGDAEPTGELGMRMRHVDGGGFVPHGDDAGGEARHAVPDRLDVAAMEAEHPVDAANFEKARDPGRACRVVGVAIGWLAIDRIAHGLDSGLGSATRAFNTWSFNTW